MEWVQSRRNCTGWQLKRLNAFVRIDIYTCRRHEHTHTHTHSLNACIDICHTQVHIKPLPPHTHSVLSSTVSGRWAGQTSKPCCMWGSFVWRQTQHKAYFQHSPQLTSIIKGSVQIQRKPCDLQSIERLMDGDDVCDCTATCFFLLDIRRWKMPPFCAHCSPHSLSMLSAARGTVEWRWRLARSTNLLWLQTVTAAHARPQRHFLTPPWCYANVNSCHFWGRCHCAFCRHGDRRLLKATVHVCVFNLSPVITRNTESRTKKKKDRNNKQEGAENMKKKNPHKVKRNW